MRQVLNRGFAPCFKELSAVNEKPLFVRVIDRMSDLIGGYLMGWLLVVMMLMILVEVLTRYIFQSPMSIAEEYGGYMMVAITFLGLGFAWKEKSHVRVEMAVNMLPLRLQQWMRLVSLIFAIGFALVLIKGSFDMVSQTQMFGERSDTWLRTPLMWPQMVLVIGSFMLLLQLMAQLIKAALVLKTGNPD